MKKGEKMVRNDRRNRMKKKRLTFCAEPTKTLLMLKNIRTYTTEEEKEANRMKGR